MTDLMSGKKESAFTFAVNEGVMNHSEFTPPPNIQRNPDRAWLQKTGTMAGQLTAQRSNIELFCLLTCTARAKDLQSDSFEDIADADAKWVSDIELWAKANPTLAHNASALTTYWKKYGFALYQNISSDRCFYLYSLYLWCRYLTCSSLIK